MDTNNQGVVLVDKEKLVDPFLVEALQNPRHRLTILRMELDIQNFLQNPEQLHFEFPHFPTSYLRLAAHRVAQHYGLQTMVLDNLVDGPGNKIIVNKTSESKYPSVCLSEIPAKQSDYNKLEQVKIAVRPRPGRTSSGDAADMERKRMIRSVEERKEEYDKARARIFSSPSSPTSDETSSQGSADGGKAMCPSKDENGGGCISDQDKNLGIRDVVGNGSRVAIFRDREKDRSDPDYDRSYERYVRSFPNDQRYFAPFSMPKFQSPYVQYDAAATFPQLGPIPGAQTSMIYGPSSNPAMTQYCTMGLNQPSADAVYMQWPSPTMMYAHSYDQLRHSVFQGQFIQQPLSFDYSQNH